MINLISTPRAWSNHLDRYESYVLGPAEVVPITPHGYPTGTGADDTWGSQLEIGIPTPERIQATLAQLLEAKPEQHKR